MGGNIYVSIKATNGSGASHYPRDYALSVDTPKVGPRYRDPQLQVDETFLYVFTLRPKMCKS